MIFLVSAFAETNRLPFDLPESEQELVGGFHTEYSAMKFGMFFLGEYLHVITVSFLTVILFFGGWDLPFVLEPGPDRVLQRAGQDAGDPVQGRPDDPLHDVGALDLPRFRYDQLMDLAWKSLIPLALVNLVATAAIVQLIYGHLIDSEFLRARANEFAEESRRCEPTTRN